MKEKLHFWITLTISVLCAVFMPLNIITHDLFGICIWSVNIIINYLNWKIYLNNAKNIKLKLFTIKFTKDIKWFGLFMLENEKHDCKYLFFIYEDNNKKVFHYFFHKNTMWVK